MDDARLSDVLSEFARTLSTDFPIQGILDHLVHRIVDVLPIHAAGVTLITPAAGPRLVAASNDTALRYEGLQTELEEGPCLAAYATDTPICIPDLSADDRFPLFAGRALAEGLAAVFAFPLRDGERGLGALDLYRETVGALDETELAAAQTLADVATAYLLNAQARNELKTSSEAESTALEKLRAVDRTKTEFLATVIHELRTPMTSIACCTERLQDAEAGVLSAEQQRLVDAIDRNSDRLTCLADDLLALAGLDQGTVLDEHTEVDLGGVVRATELALKTLIDDRGVAVSVEAPTASVLVHGDARHLERLVCNLMTNALKFTERGGWVRCVLRETDEMARLEVSDNGIGIPLAEQEHLFTRFFRASSAQRHAVPGSGLGLSIVQSIAHHHGGSVSVVSADRQGSTFTVALPLLQR